MSGFSTRRALLALAVLALAGGARAADSLPLVVSARLAAVCKLTLSGTMDFGALDPAATGDVTKVVTATYQCTTSTTVLSAAFTVGGSATGSSSSAMAAALHAGVTIPYTIGWTPPADYTGAGMASGRATRSIVLTGTIAGATSRSAVPDAYTQSVQIAVTY